MNQCNTVIFTVPTGDVTQVGQKVTFASAFAAPPDVVCSLSDCGPHARTAYLSCMAYNVTTKGFEAILKKKDATNPPRSGLQVTLHWIATDQA